MFSSHGLLVQRRNEWKIHINYKYKKKKKVHKAAAVIAPPLSINLVAESAAGARNRYRIVAVMQMGPSLMSRMHQDIFAFTLQICCGCKRSSSPSCMFWAIGSPRMHANARCERGLWEVSLLTCVFLAGEWKLEKPEETDANIRRTCGTSHRQ